MVAWVETAPSGPGMKGWGQPPARPWGSALTSQHAGGVARIRGGRRDRQLPPLARAHHEQALAVPIRPGGEEIVRPHAAQVDAPVIVPVAVIEVVEPVAVERAGAQLVVDLLGEVDRDPVDPDLEDDRPPGRELRIPGIGTHARARHLEDRGVMARRPRLAKDAVDAGGNRALRADRAEAHVVDVDRGRARLGQERHPGVDWDLVQVDARMTLLPEACT